MSTRCHSPRTVNLGLDATVEEAQVEVLTTRIRPNVDLRRATPRTLLDLQARADSANRRSRAWVDISGPLPREGRHAAPSIARAGTIDAVAALLLLCLARRSKPDDVVQATRQPFDPGSSAVGCSSDRTTSYVEGLWSPSLVRFAEIRRQKHTLNAERNLQRQAPRVFLSQAGPRFRTSVSSSWASPFIFLAASRLQNDEGDRFGRPRSKLLCG
jgi:hypothetical protein